LLTESKLTSLLQNATKELDKVNNDNRQLGANILSVKTNTHNSAIKLDILKLHLTELSKSNAIIIEAMKRSCK
jgi:hypothetical protein